MSELPRDHYTNFCPEWWNERRKRDYFIDDNGLVKLDPNSPTGCALEEMLRYEAREIAALMMAEALLRAPPAGHA